MKMSELSDVFIHSLVEGENLKWIVGWDRTMRFSVEDFLLAIEDDRFPVRKGEKLGLAKLDAYRKRAEAESGEVPAYRYIAKTGLFERRVEDEPTGLMSSTTVRQRIVDPIFAILRHSRESTFDVRYPSAPRRDRHRYPQVWRFRTLGFEEQDSLFAHMNDDFRDLAEFAVVSMMRSANIMELKWDHVKTAEGKIEMIQKGGRPFIRNINGDMQAVLERRREINALSGHVFSRMAGPYGPFSGTRVSWSTSAKHREFNLAIRAAGVEDLWFHDLRRTGASRLYDTCHDIEAVRSALGHSDPKTTWLYIHRDPTISARAEEMRSIRDELIRNALQKADGKLVSQITGAQTDVAMIATVLARHRLAQAESEASKPPQIAPPKPRLPVAEPPPSESAKPILQQIGPSALSPAERKAFRKKPDRSFVPTLVGSVPVLGAGSLYVYAPFVDCTLVACHTGGPANDRLLVTIEDDRQKYGPALSYMLDECTDLRELLTNGPAVIVSGSRACLIRNEGDLTEYRRLASWFDHQLHMFACSLTSHQSAFEPRRDDGPTMTGAPWGS